MPPVDTAHPLEVGLVAAIVAVGLVLLGRLFRGTWRMVSRSMERIAPAACLTRHRARGNGGALRAAHRRRLLRVGLRMADKSFQELDELIEPEIAPPTDPSKTGSAASLVNGTISAGRGGNSSASGPSRADIEAFLGAGALEPIRVYVGLNSADSPEERADLALRELIRRGRVRSLGARRRRSDRHGLDGPCRRWTHSTTCIAATWRASRSSILYLTSWISLLVEPGYGSDTGRALFRKVYDHWTALPQDARPRLYLYGLSLGAFSSEQSVRLYEVLGDPIQGAVWVGPPFPSPGWRSVTDERQPGSPAWLPRFDDGSIVRFTNQENALDIPGAKWGPMRIVYLQYASDPIVFFEPAALYRMPAWMARRVAPTSRPTCAGIPS